jgi:hypothetical protein
MIGLLKEKNSTVATVIEIKMNLMKSLAPLGLEESDKR